MNGYLLDTNTISLLAPDRIAPEGFSDRLASEERIFPSAVTVQEIQKGIDLLLQKGATAKAARFRLWFSGLVSAYADCVLPVDTTIATASGRLEARSLSLGHDCGIGDALIAGTADVHALTVVTRNGRHFEVFGVGLISPDDIGSRR